MEASGTLKFSGPLGCRLCILLAGPFYMSGGDERKPLAHGRRASASSEDLCALTEK